MKLRTKVLALALSIVGASTAFADTVVLNFEGIATSYPFDSSSTFIENFYNGGTRSIFTTPKTTSRAPCIGDLPQHTGRRMFQHLPWRSWRPQFSGGWPLLPKRLRHVHG